MVALPSVAAFHERDEICRRLRRDHGRRKAGGGSVRADDAPNPAAVVAEPVFRQHLRAPLGGQPVGMLDHGPIHVGDVERAVGPDPRHHRAAPAIVAGKEIGRPLLVGPARREARAIVDELVVLDEIVERLAGERVKRAWPRVKERPVTVDRAPAGRRVAPRLLERMKPLLRGARRAHRRAVGADDVPDRLLRSNEPIAGRSSFRDHPLPERIGVLRAKPVAERVAVAAELRWPRLDPHRSRIGMKAKVVATEGDLLSVGLRGDHRLGAMARMMAATGTPQQAVEAEAEAVDAELLVSLHEAFY